MNTFKNTCAQGDMILRRVKSIPKEAVKASAENGKYIVTHSESGHHHVVDASPNVSYYTTEDPLVSYLEVVEATGAMETVLEHLRSYDTHAPIKIGVGCYEIRRQREYTPEGWRRVQD